MVGMLSVCYRLSSGLSVCCRLQVQHCANDRFSIGVMSVIYRSQIGRFHTESYQTWTRLVLRCLQQHCRWPTAGRFIENVVPFVGFVSVWPVWLGYDTPVTPAKPTSNRQKSSNSGRDRFTVGIDSVLSVCCRFMFGQTNLSGRDLSNMFERSLPDKLSVVCRLYVGVVSVLSGSVRGRVGLNYVNPVYGVATICHQVRWLRWGHLSYSHVSFNLI